LYERLLKEREEEELDRGRPLNVLHGSNSAVLDRQLASVAKKRSRHGATLINLCQYVHRGVRSQGGAMQFVSLKKKYVREYTDLKAEARGQGELL
jgi:hypothetical protein